MRPGSVYILTNDKHTVLYIGCTENLQRRVYFHKRGLVRGFSKKYNVHKLVYFEVHSDIIKARIREKELKGKTREKKIALIQSTNPSWTDLYDSLSNSTQQADIMK